MGIKKRGRPPICIDGSVCASTMLPISEYDAICRRAEKIGVSISKLIRDRLLADDDHDDDAFIAGIEAFIESCVNDAVNEDFARIARVEAQLTLNQQWVDDISRRIKAFTQGY